MSPSQNSQPVMHRINLTIFSQEPSSLIILLLASLSLYTKCIKWHERIRLKNMYKWCTTGWSLSVDRFKLVPWPPLDLKPSTSLSGLVFQLAQLTSPGSVENITLSPTLVLCRSRSLLGSKKHLPFPLPGKGADDMQPHPCISDKYPLPLALSLAYLYYTFFFLSLVS